MPLASASDVLKKISHAAMRAGRCPGDIRLVAVTKTVGADLILEAIDAGLRVFGENRVQEAAPKIERFRDVPGIRWHMLGTLQKNKAKKAVEIFDVIESVDSAELARLIDRHAGELGKVQTVFIQVKLGDEESKHGVDPAEVEGLVGEVSEFRNVRIEGLMTIPPFSEDPEGSRRYFRELRALRDALAGGGFDVPGLSMGMSNDYAVAVEEGATEVRVGTAIFGGRRK